MFNIKKSLLLVPILSLTVLGLSSGLSLNQRSSKVRAEFVTCDPATNPNCVCTSQGCVITSNPPAQQSFGNGCNGLSAQQCLEQNSFVQKLQLIVNFLSAGVGLVVVAMIMFGGIKYITAGENSQAVQDAKNTIRNAIIALLVFALMFSFMQWLIPGGVFG